MHNVTANEHPAAADAIASIEQSVSSRSVRLDDAQRVLVSEIAVFLSQALAKQDAAQDAQPTGFFVHGPAGRGKSWLMSGLVAWADVPEDAKRRLHFHEFFRSFQRQTATQASTRDAIEHTLDELLDGARLFYFDELHVHEPGSGALLNRILDELATRRIPTLITSNYEPEGLLPNRIYHHIIEPGIATVRTHFAVRELDAGTDYRLTELAKHGGFASGNWVVGKPEESLAAGNPPAPEEATEVLERHRALQVSAIRGREIWFDFASLVAAHSYTEDFLNIAERYDSWVLTDVPALSKTDRASRQRFVSLIDVLVDQDCKLTVFADVSRDAFVDIKDPPADLFRCISRLALLSE
ncbi:MAG: cell division protein ZapE [Gulosibacter sp.]|uniref:cell division protein ZapE n=1 Tax=Gulosibacter sp. TaxID=2817531 RepID=UPI003F8E1AA3